MRPKYFKRTTPKPMMMIQDWTWTEKEFEDFVSFMEGKTFSTYNYWRKSWEMITYKVENGLAYAIEKTNYYCSTITSQTPIEKNTTDNKPRPLTLVRKGHEFYPSIDGEPIKQLDLYIENLRSTW